MVGSKVQEADGNHVSYHLEDHLQKQTQKQKIERWKALISVIPGLLCTYLLLRLAV